jgi:cytochrome P450
MYDEIMSVCPSHDPTYADLTSLSFLLCIMYESLRLFPFAGSISQITSTTSLLSNKYPLPESTVLTIDFINHHRNTRIWGPSAAAFNPSRFDNRSEQRGEVTYADGRIKFPAKGAFIMFGEGPRACLGRRFAEAEYVTALAMVGKEFQVGLQGGWSEEMVWEALRRGKQGLTIRMAREVPIKLTRRTKAG